MGHLKDKVIAITGSSRGIGLATALRAAKDQATIIIMGKSDQPHPKLDGTIYTAAKAVEAAGGQALPIKIDIRDESNIIDAFQKIESEFGKLDVLINNASAINTLTIEQLSSKQYDLMHQINGRGSFLCAKYAVPLLKKAQHPHILNDSPPLELIDQYFGNMGSGYVGAKILMSIWTKTLSIELKPYNIAVNSIWPSTAIATAAIKNLMPGLLKGSRKPEIVADATYHIITQNDHFRTGQFFIDEKVLLEQGIEDLSMYTTEY
ncbi:MAG: SDR family oxidoreductase [Pseudomonadota bacterium]|nr:SDR family oxidoreductase [Pseudomonadota bacterium]